LDRKTVPFAFAGSTRIAFGPAKPPIGLADVVIQRFLSGMRAGRPAGESLRAGLVAVAGADPSPTMVKTVLEFACYGDPLARLPVKSGKSIATEEPQTAPTIGAVPRTACRLTMPDVLGTARTAVDASRARIRAMLDRHITDRYPLLAGVEPTGGAWGDGKSFERFVYVASPSGPVRPVVIIDTDRQGTIRSEHISR